MRRVIGAVGYGMTIPSTPSALVAARSRSITWSAWPRVDATRGDLVELALEGPRVVRPEGAEQTDLLLETAASRPEVLAQRLVLDVVPAHPHAEDQPSARERRHLRRLLCDERRLPLRQDQHARPELDSTGEAGQESEQHERLVEQRLVCVVAAETARSIGVGAQHVVVGDQVVIAGRLGGFGVLADHRRVSSDLYLRQHHPNAHRHPPRLQGRPNASSPPGGTRHAVATRQKTARALAPRRCRGEAGAPAGARAAVLEHQGSGGDRRLTVRSSPAPVRPSTCYR